jgi:DNA-binding XRE family transcriptional regulator
MPATPGFCSERISYGGPGGTSYLGSMGELSEVRRPERLWREVLGAEIREQRRRRGLTLVQTAARAGISPQYLSEIERGLKDPSSEILAAIAGALELTVLDLTTAIVVDLRADRAVAAGPSGYAGPLRVGVGTQFHGPVALAA